MSLISPILEVCLAKFEALPFPLTSVYGTKIWTLCTMTFDLIATKMNFQGQQGNINYSLQTN